MQKIEIKRFFECLIPVTVCNLKCSYCYVIQRDYRNMKLAQLKYSPEHIGKSLSPNRLGGTCFFSICGAGETLAQPETISIVLELVKQGHIVNITTNGTLTNRFKEFEKFKPEELERIHFSFSLHYLELKRCNLLDEFFSNVNFVKNLGCSILVQLNLCDEYIPFVDDIKEICIKRVGAYPQIAATRKESHGLSQVELMSELPDEEYKKIGNSFHSDLFEFTMENFNKKRTEFCNVGERSGSLDLSTGALRKCYGAPTVQYIFDNPNSDIVFSPIGNHCCSSFCFNSSHFMALGIIDNGDKRSYCSIRNRPEAHWFNDTFKYALSKKLWSTNVIYSVDERKNINRKVARLFWTQRVKNYMRRISIRISKILRGTM